MPSFFRSIFGICLDCMSRLALNLCCRGSIDGPCSCCARPSDWAFERHRQRHERSSIWIRPWAEGSLRCPPCSPPTEVLMLTSEARASDLGRSMLSRSLHGCLLPRRLRCSAPPGAQTTRCQSPLVMVISHAAASVESALDLLLPRPAIDLLGPRFLPFDL
jgi:hypothetical protein